jgi:hypothetical protein
VNLLSALHAAGSQNDPRARHQGETQLEAWKKVEGFHSSLQVSIDAVDLE